MSGGEEWVQRSCRGGIPNGESARNLPSVRQPFRATLHPNRRHSYASRSSGEGPATPGRGQGPCIHTSSEEPVCDKEKNVLHFCRARGCLPARCKSLVDCRQKHRHCGGTSV